ncbi:hypothetical protein [Sinorhizobium chiapasense]|uniref:Uncharacterized protein n=1 Tax=Sinorhizobium chiapasense TaxID=501572 RepID=A0ABZ2B7E4_9HYPH
MEIGDAVQRIHIRYEMDESASKLTSMALFAYAVVLSGNRLVPATARTSNHVLILGREISVEFDDYLPKVPWDTLNVPSEHIDHFVNSPTLSKYVREVEPGRQTLTAPRITVLLNNRPDLESLTRPYISIAACMDAD